MAASDWINVPGVLKAAGLPGGGAGIPGLTTSATSGVNSQGSRYTFDNSGSWGNNVGGSGTQVNLGGASGGSSTLPGGLSPWLIAAAIIGLYLVMRK